MSYVVYGVRLNGDREVRYVGVTRLALKRRLQKHFSRSDLWSRQGPFLRWLRRNRSNVEIFEIERIAEIGEPAQQAALEAEKATIKLCLKLGQRLFNQTHVPHRMRLAA